MIEKKIDKVLKATMISSVLLASVLLISIMLNMDYLFLLLLLVLFCAIPLLVPFLFIRMNLKIYPHIIKRIKEDISLTARVLYLTETFIKKYSISMMFIFIFAFIFLMPVVTMSLLIFGSLIEPFTKILFIGFVLWVMAVVTYIHLTYPKALLGYPIFMPSIARSFLNVSDEEAFSGGLNEAKSYLVISRGNIEKKNIDLITPFKESIYTLNYTFKKEKNIEISNLSNIFKMLDVIKKIDYCPHRKILLEYIDRLISAIDRKEFDKLFFALGDFYNEPKLEYLRNLEPKLSIIRIEKIAKAAIPIITVFAISMTYLLNLSQHITTQLQQTFLQHGPLISFYLLMLAYLAIAFAVMQKMPPVLETDIIKILRMIARGQKSQATKTSSEEAEVGKNMEKIERK